MQDDVLVWKDINKHSDTLEATRFWACFQFLFIMPPKHGRKPDDEKWISLCMQQVQDGREKYSQYTPKCRYDEFVASHSTCCEHHNPEFAFYHRNLMSKFNLALNEADYILRTPQNDDMKIVEKGCEQKGCSEELKQAISYYNDLTEKVRKDNGGKLPWVSLFYWNPMDNLQPVKLPSFFRANSQDAMSLLHNKFKDCKFGEMNYAETWNTEWYKGRTWVPSKEVEDYIKREMGKSSKQITQSDTTLEQMNSSLNARNLLIGVLDYNLMKAATDNKGIGKFCEITDEQINFQYYGKNFQVYDFRKNSFPKQLFVNKNLQIPSYAFAHAQHQHASLVNPQQMPLFYYLINDPHDYMHVNYALPLRHPYFSITHPLFMLYHGFIEYLVEIRIRRLSKDDLRVMSDNLQKYFTGRSQQNKKMYQWIYPENNRKQNVISNATYHRYFSIGLYQDYALAEGGLIRKSDNLKKFYKDQELDLPKQLQQYPFDFTFDIVDSSNSYPPYIQTAITLYNSQAENATAKSVLRQPRQIEKIVQVKKMNEGGPNIEAEKIDGPEGKWEIKKEDKKKIEEFLEMKQEISSRSQRKFSPEEWSNYRQLDQKVIERNIALYKLCSLFGRVQYPSTMESSSVSLTIELKKLSEFKFFNCGSETVSHLKPRIIGNEGKIIIKVYPVFARGKLAVICSKCRKSKSENLNLLTDFKGTLLPYLIDLHANANLGVLYDSRGLLQPEISFSEILNTSNDHEQDGFKFTLLQGAKRVVFHVQFCTNVESYEVGNCEQCKKYVYQIAVKAEVYNLTTEKPHMWIKSYKTTANTDLIFEEHSGIEVDKAEPGLPENKDELIYRSFVGTLFYKRKDGSNTESVDFKFDIKNFELQAEYDIRVNSKKDILVRSSHLRQKKYIFQ